MHATSENTNVPLPALIAHCDWSTSERKRWIASAKLSDDQYHLSAPRNVGPNLLSSLLSPGLHGCVLAGFDFPIGLPLLYGRATGFTNFRQAVIEFGKAGPWAQWFEVAEVPDHLSIYRPFYPMRPGGTRQSHLAQALQVESVGELRRLCEQSTIDRRQACPLFWTLGGNQVGKAAISGWREIIRPALEAPGVALWPFDGELPELVDKSRLVLAETYPAEAYAHAGIKFRSGMSKRRQADRATFATALRKWAQSGGHRLEFELGEMINDGFGSTAEGEDMFDAFLGLCSMLEVATGRRPDGHPRSQQILDWEGWILGQSSDRSIDAVSAIADACGAGVPID
jgi:hypothetical protein